MQRILDILQRIFAQMFVPPSRPDAEFHFCLSGVPPFILARTETGMVYKIMPDGTTTLLVGGTYPVPMTGEFCPYPETLWRLHVGIFFRQYGRLLPKIALGVIALLCVQVLLIGTGGEAFLPTFVAVMDCLLLFGLAASFVALVVWNYKRGLTIKFGDTDGLLSAGWPDIRPDILCVTDSQDEQPYILADKIENVRVGQQPGQWIVVLAYKNPAGVIICPDNEDGQRVEYAFRRDALMSDLPGWKQEVCTPRPFKYETWTEFVNYVRYFGEQYTEWAKWERSQSGNPSEELVSSLRAMAKKAAVVIAFLLCSLVAFADPESVQQIPQGVGQSVWKSVPDSGRLEAYKLEMLAAKERIGQELRPRQAFIMWCFHYFVLPVFFVLWLLAYFVAKVGFKESEHDYDGRVIFGHGIAWYAHRARAFVFVLAVIVSLIEIADTMIAAYFTERSLWWAAIVSLFWAACAYFITTNWLVPNPKTPVDSGHQMRGLGGGNQFPRLG